MAEVEMLCDRIAILNGGNVAFLGTVEKLSTHVEKHCSITIETEQGSEFFQAEDIGDTLLAVLEEYKQKRNSVLDVTIRRGTLEQHFMELAGGNVG